MEIRLQKWLSQAGVASRRKAERLILEGKVAVNGTVITELGTKADTSKDIVTVLGQACEIIEKKRYIALHKPMGVVTTVADQFGRPAVIDYLPDAEGCYPVGRLDYDTSGLLLITNDGDFAARVTHPRYGIAKIYIATVVGTPTEDAMLAFRTGLIIDGQVTAPCDIEVISTKKEPHTRLRIKLMEGRNRQVRKMCSAIGCEVIALTRVGIGNIVLGELQVGEWRDLTVKECAELSGK